MRIAVNLLPFRRELAGAGRYTVNVLRELVSMDGETEFVFFVAPRAAEHFDFGAHNVTLRVLKMPENLAARIFFEQVALPREKGFDVLFTPSVAIPLLWGGKKVTVIYDMMAEHGALKKYPPLRSAYVRRMSRYAARKSDAIVTISAFSRGEIAKFAGVAEEKIVVAPPATDFVRVTDEVVLAEVRERYRLPEKFILYVGTLEPGKNLPFLVRAYARLKREHTELEHHLVLAGASGWGVKAVEAEIARSDATGFDLIGFVAQEDLAAVYSLADVFVFPSLFEGFGMPPLEAMACGTPVITSNVSSLPEVVGGAGRAQRESSIEWNSTAEQSSGEKHSKNPEHSLGHSPVGGAGLSIAPDDEQGWADAMWRLLTDGALRETLRARGLERAREFSWRASAEVVRRALHHV